MTILTIVKLVSAATLMMNLSYQIAKVAWNENRAVPRHITTKTANAVGPRPTSVGFIKGLAIVNHMKSAQMWRENQRQDFLLNTMVKNWVNKVKPQHLQRPLRHLQPLRQRLLHQNQQRPLLQEPKNEHLEYEVLTYCPVNVVPGESAEIILKTSMIGQTLTSAKWCMH